MGKPRFRSLGRARTIVGAICLAFASAGEGAAYAGSGPPASPVPPASKMPPIQVSLTLLTADPAAHVVREGEGSLSAAVLGSPDYDLAAIDPATLQLAGAPVNKERTALADVDGDGRVDLVLRVRLSRMRLTRETRTLTLTGAFLDGRPLAGSTAVEIAPRTPPDPVQEKLPVLEVRIEVAPGDAAPFVDRGARGDLEVAIHGSDTCDAAKIDPVTLDLAGARIAENEDGDPIVRLEDLDGDGHQDLMASFPRRALRAAPGSGTMDLHGALAGGREIHGSSPAFLQGAAPVSEPLVPTVAATFTNPAPITIPAGAPGSSSGPASPYPSSITVSNLPGFVQLVSVTLIGLSHTFPDDLDVLLVGPGGQNLILMSDTGGSTDAAGVTLTFQDAAAGLLPDEGALMSGAYRPTNVDSGDAFPAPAPSPSSATSLSEFNGTEPNGTWRLYILDDNAVDFGALAGGWSLTIVTSVTQVCNGTPVVVPGSGTSGPASPYPTTIAVSGILGVLTRATLNLQGLVHSFPDDLDFLLTGPGGANAIVMSDTGGSTGTGGVINVTLDDAAATPLPDETPLQSGTFRPANYGAGDAFPQPAPSPSGDTALSIFNGRDPNGSWSLFGVDDAEADQGALQGGWCLTLTTTTCVSGAPCDDGNPCTDDLCDAATGRCTSVPDDTNTCTDGDGCTKDECVDGLCVSVPGVGTFDFANTAPIAIPAGAPASTIGPASPYPATIVVPPLGAPISRVDVTLHGMSHTFPDDVDVLLVSPGGKNVILMSDAGLDQDLVNATLTFSDDADQSLPDSDPIVPGAFRPTNFGAGDAFPAPAPPLSSATTMSVFNGTDPAGTWRLFIVDDASQDYGHVAGGWSLEIVVDCDDHDACTQDTCTPNGCEYVGTYCGDDFNVCTDDTCDPVLGCLYTPNDNACDDQNVCTTGDRCAGGSCVGGPSINCDDRNPCTADTCVADHGCDHIPTNDPCTDDNPCTVNDRCSAGECVSGPPDACDDGNPCTDDACEPSSGCVHTANGHPCSDGDACTTGDTCSGGACRGGPAIACDDGNVCTDDACDPARGCVFTSNNSCNTKGAGYWKQLCRGPHSGDAYTAYDVDCVNDTCTFAAVSSVADLCDRLAPDPTSDPCERAEADFMDLLLNLCRQRVLPGQSIDSHCGPHQTVAASRAAADAALCDPARSADSCQDAECAASEITSGEALGSNSLRVTVEGAGIRLRWALPYAGPDGLAAPRRFRVFRRTAPAAVAVQIGEVNGSGLTFLDADAAAGSTAYVYEVVSVW